MINTEHVQEILDFIEANPHLHDQSDYFIETECGTTMCIAGTSVHLKGALQTSSWWAFDSARNNMGIDFDTADRLFYMMDNDVALDMLRALANNDLDKFNHIFEENEEKMMD